ncbi:IS3 family transposase, partial [Tumebacillus permanentifrigoris]
MARSRQVETTRRDLTPTFENIRQLAGQYAVSLLCRIAKVSKSGYYKWLHRQANPSAKKLDDEATQAKILECYRKVRGIYGYRRIKISLQQEYGITVNHKRVYRLMQVLGIQSRIRRKRKYFGRREATVVSPNLLNRNFKATKPNEKWVTDITFLSVQGQWLYLSVLLDLYNNEVISYRISERNDLPLVLETVKAAIKKRKPKGVHLHSDQGHQYTSRQYHKLLSTSGITASMSRKGNCLDNACAESFFSHLKSECIYLDKFKSKTELEVAVKRYVKFYNHKRFQSRLKNHSPVRYRTM